MDKIILSNKQEPSLYQIEDILKYINLSLLNFDNISGLLSELKEIASIDSIESDLANKAYRKILPRINNILELLTVLGQEVNVLLNENIAMDKEN